MPALSECDFGTWAGRTLAEVSEQDPDGARAWMTDPDARPHGGETLAELLERVGDWLDEQARLQGRAIAVTHGGVVKAAVVHALGAPPMAFWRVDVAPLTADRAARRTTGAGRSRASTRRWSPSPNDATAAA